MPSILRLYSGSRDGQVAVNDFNVLTGATHPRGLLAPDHRDTVQSVVAHHDSHAVFTAARRDISQFSAADFKRSHAEPHAHERSVRSMCVLDNHEGAYLVSASRD